MKAKFVNEGIKHLAGRSPEEILKSVKSSKDLYSLSQLLDSAPKFQPEIVEKMITLDTEGFIGNYLKPSLKYNEKSKQLLKKYVDKNIDKMFVDNIIKIAKILPDKILMNKAMEKLKAKSQITNKNKRTFRDDINDVCKKFWENQGIKFYEITDLDINIANIKLNKYAENAESVICVHAYLQADGNGHIVNALRGYTIKGGNLSSQEYNLMTKSYNWAV